MVAALFLGSRKMGQVNTPPASVHALEHFSYYTLMAMLVAIGVARQFVWIAMAGCLVGVLDEWHQHFIPGRTASATDWGIDTMGAFLGAKIVRDILDERS
jgi:VanZ family protein